MDRTLPEILITFYIQAIFQMNQVYVYIFFPFSYHKIVC